jgi:MFS superfamily sulfate permease-like transporter
MKKNTTPNFSPFKELQADGPAAIVVFLVALPLCLGIALASGAPLFSGIIAGVVGGIVVGALSGSSLGVSGPAAGLTVIVLGAIQGLPSFETFLLAVVLAGIIQIVLGLLKAGSIGHYIPSSVIKGMLAAIGLILIRKQIPYALGYEANPQGGTGEGMMAMLEQFNMGAIIIGALCLGVMILWETSFIKSKKIFQLVQGPLVVVLLGIGLTALFNAYFPALALNASFMVSLPKAEGFGEILQLFTHPDFSQLMNVEVYQVAFTLAIVASLETLLSVEATDKLDPYKRSTPTNRELIAQGGGNIVSGLIGGLPLTQVIVRSSANVSSGGRTKASAVMHGILLMGCVLMIPGVLNMIPLASLAAILLVVGYKLAKIALFRDMYKKGWWQFTPFVATIGAILLTDLLLGIMIGLGVAVFFILLHHYKLPFRIQKESKNGEHTVTMTLSESVTFLHKAPIMRTFQDVPAGSKMVIDCTKAFKIDHDVLELIDNFTKKAEKREIQLSVVGLEKGNSVQ